MGVASTQVWSVIGFPPELKFHFETFYAEYYTRKYVSIYELYYIIQITMA